MAKWTPIPMGKALGGRLRDGAFIRRRLGSVTAVSIDAYEALGAAEYIRVLTAGRLVRIEPCGFRDAHARRLTPVKKGGSFSCSGLPLPDGERIYCEVVAGGLEFRLPKPARPQQ